MAFQLSLSSPTPFPSPPNKSSNRSGLIPTGSVRKIGQIWRAEIGSVLKQSTAVRSSLDKAGPPSLDKAGPVVGLVTEVDKDTFWPLVKAAGSKIVVLDMYTQWCGPCKVIAPRFQELSQTYLDVVFLKLDCNKENKSLAKELGIKVVPTFKILKDSEVVKEVTGAKIDDLILAIETVKSSS